MMELRWSSENSANNVERRPGRKGVYKAHQTSRFSLGCQQFTAGGAEFF
jgi:hypothetical protein